MKTLAYFLALTTGLTLAHASLAADPKGPRLGFDVAGLEKRMMAPDMMTTGSIAGQNPSFSVVFLSDLNPDDPTRRTVEQAAVNPLRVATARAVVNAEPAMLSALRAQNLDAENVIGVARDKDGSDVVYVK